MSFRYKSALFSLVSTAAVYIWFFATLMARRNQAGHLNPVMHLGSAILALAVIQIVGRVLIAGTSSDKYDAMDERERVFDRRAANVGYHVLIAGALTAIATLHLGFNGPDVGHMVLLAIVIAECVRQAVFLIAHHQAE